MARGLGRKQERKKQEHTHKKKKNKRGDRKEESNDSPEIPDRRGTSDISGLTSGWEKNNKCADSLIIVNYFMFNRLLLIIVYLNKAQ